MRRIVLARTRTIQVQIFIMQPSVFAARNPAGHPPMVFPEFVLHTGYPAIVQVQFVKGISVPGRRLVQDPLVPVALALKRLAGLRLVEMD